MQVTETLSEGLKRGFTVIVPAADIESRRTARLTDLGKTLRIPGFRPGKVPLPVVKQRYGTAVNAEVLEESVNEATRQVLSDRGLRPAVQPKVDVVNVETDKGADLEFKVEVELLPEIILPDFSQITLTRPKAEVADAALDTALHEIGQRNRDLVDGHEGRYAENGDVVTVDYVGRVDGEAFPGGSATDADVEVGGSGFIPGFTEQLTGLHVGDTRTISVTFPAEYGEASLAGKAAEFEFNVKRLRTPVAAELDENFAQKLGFDTIDDIRDVLRRQFQREYDQLSRMRVKRQLFDKLADHTDFTAPESMLDAEFAQIWQRVEADRKAGKMDAEDAGKDEETLKAEFRTIAERRVKLGLLLAEVGRANGVTVGDDEMTRAMRTEASRYPGQEAQVVEFFRKNPQAAETLRGPIFEDKVVDYILDTATVQDELVTPEELARDPDAADDSALTGITGSDGQGA